MSISIGAFFSAPEGELEKTGEVSLRMLLPMGIFAALSVLLGIFASPLVRYFAALAAAVIRG